MTSNVSKAFKTFRGKQFTLYSSGTSKKVDQYIKDYGIPQNALHRVVKVGNENRLYLHFKK